MRRFPTLAPIVCNICTVLVFMAGAAHAQSGDNPSAERKLSTAVAPAYPLGRAGQRWAELVNAAVAGAFEVKQYPGATLTQRDAGRELFGLRDGAADMAVGSALAWSAQLPPLAVFGLPWLAADARDRDALAADPALREGVFASLADAGVVGLAIAPLGERVLATVRSAPTAPANLAGLRIRTQPLPILADTLTAVGALPQSMSLPDAQRAFVAGTLDGQEGQATVFTATQIAAMGQKSVTRWGAFADVMIFAVRRPVWDAWTQGQRAAVRAAATQAATESAASAREDAALNELVRQGVTIVRPTATQRAAFRAAAAPVYEKWTPLIGLDLVRAAEAVVAAPAPLPAPAADPPPKAPAMPSPPATEPVNPAPGAPSANPAKPLS